MSVRPAQIRYLVEGKALGAKLHRGWAATWNWVLSFVHHLKGGKGVTVKDKAGGHPVIETLIESGPGIEVTCGGDGQPYVIGLANDSVDDANGPDDDVVTSLNDGTGDMDIIGGESIRVDTEGQTIRISYNEGKEADEDPNAGDGDDLGYCNVIAQDDPDGGNDISGGFGPGIGNSGGEDGTVHDNDISLNPCKEAA